MIISCVSIQSVFLSKKLDNLSDKVTVQLSNQLSNQSGNAVETQQTNDVYWAILNLAMLALLTYLAIQINTIKHERHSTEQTSIEQTRIEKNSTEQTEQAIDKFEQAELLDNIMQVQVSEISLPALPASRAQTQGHEQVHNQPQVRNQTHASVQSQLQPSYLPKTTQPQTTQTQTAQPKTVKSMSSRGDIVSDLMSNAAMPNTKMSNENLLKENMSTQNGPTTSMSTSEESVHSHEIHSHEIHSGDVSSLQLQRALDTLIDAQLQIALPTSRSLQTKTLHFLETCVGVGLAALRTDAQADSQAYSKGKIQQNKQQHQLMPITSLPEQASKILRQISGEMSLNEQRLSAAYAPNAVLFRVYPAAFDVSLSNYIAEQLRGAKLKQFYAQYDVHKNKLYLKNISLNHTQIGQTWLLFDGDGANCRL